MNAHQTRFPSPLLPLVGIFFLLNLSGCSQITKTKTSSSASTETEIRISNGVPEWVTKTPHSNSSYDQVVTVPVNGDLEQAKSQAFSLGAKKIQHQVNGDIQVHYVKVVSSDEQSYGELERKIRTKIRNRLMEVEFVKPKIKAVYENKASKELSVWVQSTKKDIATSIGNSLLETDKKLKDFIHVSERGSDLDQLLSVLPALPTLEKRQRLRNALSVFLKRPALLDSDELAELLNSYITRKFDDLRVNLQATTTDSKPFESYLQQSLLNQGVPVSVRKPDLVIKYFLEFDDDGVKQGKQSLSLVSDAEMVDDKGATFASVSKEYPATADTVSNARKQAIDAFTADISQAIIKSIIAYMDKVNKFQAFH